MSAIPKLRHLAAGLCLVLAAGLARTQPLDDLLQRAETLRSQDPVAFAATLQEIGAHEASATREQRQRFQLLRAYQLAMKGRYDAAITLAIEVNSNAASALVRFRSGLLVANAAAVTREFSLGLKHLEAALALQNEVKDTDARHTGLGVAAVLYNQYGQYALGQQYADQMLALDLSPRNRCYARQHRVESLHGLGSELDENEIVSAIKFCQAHQEPMAANMLRGYLARAWASRSEIGRAIQLLESHLREAEATQYPRLVGEFHGLLAEYHLMMNDVSQAEEHASAALEKGGSGSYSLPLVMAHRVLYESALRRKDLARALDQFKKYAEADKARLDETKAREFAFQLSRRELQQKTQAIELLQQQNEVLRLQQEVSRASAQNSQLLMALLAMVLTAIGMWAYKVKRVQVAFRRAAEVDGLTGLSNRRHFRQNAEALLQRCAGTGRESSLVLLDLDHFKHINDRHGHAVGDWVLQQVAVAIQAACREGDVCGRLGGEEFAILSCGSDMDAARRIAQRCSEHLAAIDTSVIGRPVTASFGCTTSARSGYAFESMFAHADAAMYQAKAGGRDRVRAYGEDGVGPATVLELVRS